ncbi:VRR-NUC domain-containing protein [Lactobacillus selangorensis]|uniref:VRR-NUC domain-containing protein n=1 Tax=Lactobacillus selangorensis TaxID=81857 RepID=UPI00070E6B20|nr:VRR-NUC domain-containing protein [Lactobacillus selangorensis]
MTEEHKIQNDIRVAVSAHGCTIFRTNVGKVKMQNNRWFDTGLPRGFPDLFGFKHSDGKIFFIEVKNENGRPRPDQIKFHDFLTRVGVIHGIARSSEDALKIIDEELVGYGY